MSPAIRVVGAVIKRGELVLCARRSRGAELAGLWEFPGGKIEADESPAGALEREILEELGCIIRAGEHIRTIHYEYAFGLVELSTYRCEILSGVPQPLVHTELRWLAVSQLNILRWAPADIPTVEALQGAI